MSNGDTIRTGYRNYSRFYLTWSVAKQDIPNNRTLINWTVGIQGQPGYTAYWYSNAVRVNSVYIDGGSNLASGTWSNITLVNGQSVPLRSGSKWVYHSSNGAKSFSASLSGWLYAYGDITASDSWSLPTIPRNSQVSTDKSFYTLGDPIVINTNRKSSSFTHTVTIRHNNSSGTLLKTINSVGASTTWTPSPTEITTMQNLIPNSNSLTIHINSHNNQVGEGSSVNRVLTLTEANPIFTDFTYQDSNATVVSITGDNQVLVKGKSTLETTISSANKMVAIKGASPNRYNIVYDGDTKQEAYKATGDVVNTFTPNTIGERTILATAFDSRGNNTSVSKRVTVYDYAPPTIEATLARENNFGNDTTIHLEGDWTPLVIGGAAKNALTTGSLRYRYMEDGGTFGSWTTRTFSVAGESWTISSDFIVNLDNQKKYIFEFEIADKFGAVTTQATVDIGQPIMFIGENDGISSIGLGTMPDPGVALQVGENFKIDASGNIDSATLINAVYPVGSIYLSINNTNPGDIFGGTWVSWGAGRVPVGVDTGQTEFNTVEKTGGHKLLQAHTHTGSTNTTGQHGHGVNTNLTRYSGGTSEVGLAGGGAKYLSATTFSADGNHSHTFTTASTGGGNAENLQPYITCYMWKRIS